MIEIIDGFPHDIREAIELGSSFDITFKKIKKICIGGMGGSAIGGELLQTLSLFPHEPEGLTLVSPENAAYQFSKALLPVHRGLSATQDRRVHRFLVRYLCDQVDGITAGANEKNLSTHLHQVHAPIARERLRSEHAYCLVLDKPSLAAAFQEIEDAEHHTYNGGQYQDHPEQIPDSKWGHAH